MSNASVISKIEYLDNEAYVDVNFQSYSASYEVKGQRNSQGLLYKHTLSFDLSGLQREDAETIRRMRRSKSIRFTDVNGLRISLGGGPARIIVTDSASIDGKPGAVRGRKVTVEWSSLPGESFI